MNLANEPVRAVPKPSFPRGKAKRSKRAEFSPSVRRAIIKRDKGRCVKCKQPYHNIHHIFPRARGGLGTIDNGVLLCYPCHEEAHASKEGLEFYMRYREINLLHKEAESNAGT